MWVLCSPPLTKPPSSREGFANCRSAGGLFLPQRRKRSAGMEMWKMTQKPVKSGSFIQSLCSHEPAESTAMLCFVRGLLFRPCRGPVCRTVQASGEYASLFTVSNPNNRPHGLRSRSRRPHLFVENGTDFRSCPSP